MTTILTLICAGIFFLIGGILLVLALNTRSSSDLSREWPEVDGVVLAAAMQEYAHLETEVGKAKHTYEPVVTYQYTVNGHPFTNHRISVGASRFNYRTAEKILKRYASGTAVHVHYNPQDPQESVLETMPAGNRWMLALSLFILAIGVGIILFGILRNLLF